VSTTLPNPLVSREPELVERLSKFRERVNHMLLDGLAAHALRDPVFLAERCPHALEDVKATALLLRMLTQESWTRHDMRIFDACWRPASHSFLFADEFEASRHLIRHYVEEVQEELRDREYSLF
jgi:hypothetical protein